MKKRTLAVILASVLTVVGLSACGSSTTSSSAGGSASATSETSSAAETNSDLEDFDLVLDWYPNAVHSFIYDAIDKGYFEEEGLNVNILFPSNNNDPISLSAVGKVDAGLYYQDDIIMAKANEDVPVVTIGTVVREPLDTISFLKSTGITRPKDLEGKTLGTTGVEFGDALIKKMMENDGSSIDKVNVVNVGFDLMSAMTTGNVDATFGCFINHEIPQLEKEGFEMGYFRPSDFGIPNYYSLVFVAGQDSVNNNPEKYHKFLRACSKGFYDMKNNPEDTLKILLANQNEENFALDPDVETKSMEILLPLMEGEYDPFLSQDPDCYQKNISWLKENGLIDKDITPDDIIVDAIDGDYYLGE